MASMKPKANSQNQIIQEDNSQNKHCQKIPLLSQSSHLCVQKIPTPQDGHLKNEKKMCFQTNGF